MNALGGGLALTVLAGALLSACDTTRFETRRGNEPPGTCPSTSCGDLVSVSGGACASSVGDPSVWTRVGGATVREGTLVIPGATPPARNYAFHTIQVGAAWRLSFAVRLRIVGDPGFRPSLAKVASASGSLQLFYTPANKRLQVCLSGGTCRDTEFPYADFREAHLIALTVDRVDANGASGVAVAIDCAPAVSLGDLTQPSAGVPLVSQELRAVLGNDDSQSQELELTEAVIFDLDR